MSSHRFPSEIIPVNHLYHTMSNCVKWGYFNVRHLVMPFTLSFTDIQECKWAFCFSILKTADNPMLYEFKTSLQILTIPCLLLISRFLRNQSYMFPLASSTLFTHLWIFWNHYNSLMSPIRSGYPKTVMESTHTHIPEVPNGRTFSLDTTFLKCQASTSARLKEFYCFITQCDKRLTFRHWNYFFFNFSTPCI